MAQWGQEKIINGARFVPNVATEAFVAATSQDSVADVVLVDDGGDAAMAAATLAALRSKHNVEPYASWLLLSNV